MAVDDNDEEDAIPGVDVRSCAEAAAS